MAKKLYNIFLSKETKESIENLKSFKMPEFPKNISEHLNVDFSPPELSIPDNLSERIDSKHLEFLDFILPKLSKVYDQPLSLSDLAHKYKKTNKKFQYDNTWLKAFMSVYNHTYFVHVHPSNDCVKIISKYKFIIDKHRSLSNYLNRKSQSSSKTPRFNRIINRLAKNPIIVSISILVLLFTFIDIVLSFFGMSLVF